MSRVVSNERTKKNYSKQNSIWPSDDIDILVFNI
jgi:hypothetical protein